MNTVEHYRAARTRLAPGGLFCQWLPLHQLGPRELELIADSFVSVFPHTALWWADSTSLTVLGLVGSDEPIVVRAPDIGARLRSVRDPLAGSGQLFRSPEEFARLYLGDWTARNPRYLNTDEHPRVEFLAPAAHRNQELLTGKALEAYRRAVLDNLPRHSIAPPALTPGGRETAVDFLTIDSRLY